MNKLFVLMMLWMMSCLPTLAQGCYFLGKRCTSVEKTIKNTVALLVSNLIFIYLQLLS